MVNGGVRHYNAQIARMSDNLCSLQGRFFVQEEPESHGIPMIMCSAEGCGVILDIEQVPSSGNKVLYSGLPSYDEMT